MTNKKYFDENTYEYLDDYFVLKVKNRKGEIFESKIDYENLKIIFSYKWHIHGSKNKPKYVMNQNNEFLHRILTNCPDDMIVDHINRDSLDNRIVNLKICTMAENNANMSKRTRNCTSKYRYIEEIKEGYRQQKFAVDVRRRFRRRFYTLEDAIEERNLYIMNNEPELWRTHKKELISDCVQVGFGADYLEDEDEEE